MERPKIKSLSFDLDTNEMKAADLYPKGYYILRRDLQALGFEHNQGSRYVSNKKMTKTDVYDILAEIRDKNPWLKNCTRKLSVSNPCREYDFIAVLQGSEKGEELHREQEQEM